jgi:hypothetical protein
MCPQHLQKVLDFLSFFFEDAARGLLLPPATVNACERRFRHEPSYRPVIYKYLFISAQYRGVPAPPGVILPAPSVSFYRYSYDTDENWFGFSIK